MKSEGSGKCERMSSHQSCDAVLVRFATIGTTVYGRSTDLHSLPATYNAADQGLTHSHCYIMSASLYPLVFVSRQMGEGLCLFSHVLPRRIASANRRDFGSSACTDVITRRQTYVAPRAAGSQFGSTGCYGALHSRQAPITQASQSRRQLRNRRDILTPCPTSSPPLQPSHINETDNL